LISKLSDVHRALVGFMLGIHLYGHGRPPVH
jgi:hypothetical protein